MIITTRRPARIYVMDIAITGVAWVAFIYQFTNGVVFLMSERPGTPLSSIWGLELSRSATTVIVCVLVCTFNAAVVYLWARLRDSSHGRAYAVITQDVTKDVLASHFSLLPEQVDDVQVSRVTIFYHSPTGGIVGLETARTDRDDAVLHQVPQPAFVTA